MNLLTAEMTALNFPARQQTMKTFATILVRSIALVILTVLPTSMAQTATTNELPAVLTPYLQNPAADGMTVCFLAQGAEGVRVAWALDAAPALTEAPAAGTAIPGTPWTIWKTRLAKLDRGTVYRYQVRYRLPSGSAVSPVARFHTLDPQSKTLRFAAFNDLHNNDQTLEALLRFVKPDDYEFSLLMGDCFGDPTAANGAHEVFRTWQAYLRWLDGGNKPIVFVRGNHETRGNFSPQLAHLFDLPNLDAAQKQDDQQWQFTLRAGPVWFLAMDTGEDEDMLADPRCAYKRPKFWQTYRQREAEWLEKLRTTQPGNDVVWRIFASHIPLYNDNQDYSPNGRQSWEPILQHFDLDLMLVGHDHGWKLLPKKTGGQPPWPVLIGGGPALDQGTVILVSAETTGLRARVIAAKDGRLLTEFNAQAERPGKP